MTKTLALVLFLFVVTNVRQPAIAADPAGGCSQFVQQFYDWYVAHKRTLMGENSEKSVVEVALQIWRSSFSPEVTKALGEFISATRKSVEVIRFDFDPVLNIQEGAGQYAVGEVHAKGDHYLVDVFEIVDGTKKAKPTVTPELVAKNGEWVFTNFHYDEGDLLSVLEHLKKDREQTKKSGP